MIRSLYRKGFSEGYIKNLFIFIDWVLDLPKKEEEKFLDDLSQLEEKNKMQYVTSIERVIMRRGKKEGIKEGLKEGKREGKKEGKREGKKEVAVNCLKKGFADNLILELTGLDPKDLQIIKKRATC